MAMVVELAQGPAPLPQAENMALEEELAGVLSSLLADQRSAEDTVAEVAASCCRRAELLRNESIEQIHRPARHMHLKALAEEMDAQAATWQLVFCLYCDQAEAAGDGGRAVTDAAGAKLYRQRVADSISASPELSRCARVVAWLESLADDVLKRQAGAAFAQGEGLWSETRAEMRTGTGALVSELDPDAPTRSGRSLHSSNVRAQERIMARAWQLIRAGRLPEALHLCRQVGQAWRAAALGGAGEYGAVPVGTAATEHDELVPELLQAEELAAEVASGSGTLQALWRWACLFASSSGDKFERAVWGALGGSVSAMAPACSSWEDFCWMYCRAWLEVHAAKAVPLEPHAASNLVSGDAVLAALSRCGVPVAGAQRTLEAANGVVLGTGWPAEQHAALASRTFAALLHHFIMSPGAMMGSGGAALRALRQVQCSLVQGASYELACQLQATLIGRPPMDSDGSMLGAEPDGSVVMADVAPPVGGAEGGGDGGSGSNSEQRWRMLALGAHLLLALEGLGVVTGPGAQEQGVRPLLLMGGEEPDPFETYKTLDMSQRLLALYVASLLERNQPALVHPYLCCLRLPLRPALADELLAHYTRRLTGLEDAGFRAGEQAQAAQQQQQPALGANSAVDADCFAAYQALAEWFSHCTARQQVPPPHTPSSRIVTDIRPDEARILLSSFVQACRRSRAYGPVPRVRAARWLAYPFLAALRQQHERAEEERDLAMGGGADAEAAAAGQLAAAAARSLQGPELMDALDLANCLCAELALGDETTAMAGQLLFADVLPEGFEDAAAAAAQAMAGGGDEAAALAQQLWDQATELAGWRQYYQLDAGLARWLARHEALQAGDTEAGAAADVAAEGGELLRALMDGVLVGGWQEELCGAKRALDAAAASPSGHPIVTLLLTAAPFSPAAGSGGGGWGNEPTACFPELKGAVLYEVEVALRASLERAVAAADPSLAASVEAPEGAQGHLSVTIASTAEPESWRAMVGVVCALLRGEVPGQPPLLLANLEADRATSLAVCRTCCVGQVAVRCAALRQSLVTLGEAASSSLSGCELVELLAAPRNGGPLAVLLSQGQLKQLLGLEADTLVQELRNRQRQR